MNVIESKLIIS